VGATENIMIAGALASGETTIENAAQDQQVVELGKFLMLVGENPWAWNQGYTY